MWARRLLTIGAATSAAVALSGCPPPRKPPVVHPPEPPPLRPPETPGTPGVPHTPPASGAAASELEQVGKSSDGAREVICQAIDVTGDADLVRQGKLTEGQFVQKYQARLRRDEGEYAASKAAAIYQLLKDVSDGDLAAVSRDLACLA